MAAHTPLPVNDDLPQTEPFISQANLADRLNVSIATLARARKKDLLHGHLIGGQWRFSKQQIFDYLKRTEEPLRLYGGRLNDTDVSLPVVGTPSD